MSTIFGYSCIFVVGLTILCVRFFLGFEFPIPWNDETAFIAQAFELSRTGSLYVWGMKQEGIVMWMPPGYMVLLAGIYKLVGYSFDISRWVSAIFYFLSYVILWKIARDQIKGKLQALGIAILTVAFLSPNALPTANVARMETFYSILFLLSMLFAINRHIMCSLAIIIATATIHFNAIYFTLPLSIYLVWQFTTRGRLHPQKWEWLPMLLAVVIVGAYVIFVLENMEDFAHDMRFQFSYKFESPLMGGTNGWVLLGMASIIPATILSVKRSFDVEVWLAFYGISFLIMALNGHNMWYYFGFAFAFTLLILSICICATHTKNRFFQVFLVAAFFGILYPFWNKSILPNEQFQPMLPTLKKFGASFLPADEINKLKAELANLPTGASVSFGFTGVEPFFFETLATHQIKWSISGHSVTQVFPPRSLDYRAHCDSAMFPAYLFVYDWDGYPRKGADTGCKIIKLGQHQ